MFEQVTTALVPISIFVGQMLILTTGVWFSAEALGRYLPGKKIHYALALGPIAACTAYGAGFVATPTEGGWSWAFVGVMGLLCSLGAKAFNDKVNPLKKVRE